MPIVCASNADQTLPEYIAMLNLIDLIEHTGFDLGKWKIHCASDNKNSEFRPLENYFAGTFEDHQAKQGQENFKCDYVVSLINMSNSQRWLFAGVYKVNGRPAKKRWGFLYDLTRVKTFEHLEGRTIVAFNKNFRNSYLVGPRHRDQLVVVAFEEERRTIGEFPGFHAFRISYETLKAVVEQENASWRSALSSVAGIYVITDRQTGCLYVGSAYGDGGIWNRWREYGVSGHGENAELKQLLRRNGKEYANNFQFAILEVCDTHRTLEYVVSRENHWKDVLMSRVFGLNWN